VSFTDNAEKWFKEGQASDDTRNTVYAHCMLRTLAHKHTLTICTAFLLQQFLHEHASMTIYMYIVCLYSVK